MMKNQPKSNRNRIKMALIPVLALILIAVLFRPSDKEVTANASSLADGQPRVAKQPIRAAKADPRNWPKADMKELIAFNPFELPKPPPPPEPEVTADDAGSLSAPDGDTASETKRTAPKKKTIGKVQAIYQDAHGSVAIVNSKIVRVGDLIDDCRVVEITPQGIVVESD